MRTLWTALLIAAALASPSRAETPSASAGISASTPEILSDPDPVPGPAVMVSLVEPGTIRIDGDLSEWGFGETAGIVDTRADREDLSAEFLLAVDRERLYLGVQVHDATFSQRHYGADIWNGDSIQFALDPPYARTSGSYGPGDQEYGVALDGEDPILWRWKGSAGMRNGRVHEASATVRRLENLTLYELALPFEALGGLHPGIHPLSGFNLAVNDSDDREREDFIQWTPGIADGKNPASFGTLIFPTEEMLAKEGFVSTFRLADRFAGPGKAYPVEWTVRSAKSQAVPVTVRFLSGDRVVASGEARVEVPEGVSRTMLHVILDLPKPEKLQMQISAGGWSREFTVYKHLGE